MGAAASDLPRLQHHDLVHLVQPAQFVGNEQGGPALGDVQQVGGESGPGLRVQVGRRLVQDQQVRRGEQGPGQREPLAFPAGYRAAAGPGRGIPAPRERLDPGQQPRLPGGLGQFAVGGGRARQPEVLPDAGIEDMRVLRAAADQRAHVVGPVGAQVVAAQRGAAAGQVAEPEQDRGDRGLPRPARADQRDPPPGHQVQVDPVQGQRAVRLVPYPGVMQRHPQRAAGQRARRGRVGDRVGCVQDLAYPGRAGARLA